MAALRVHAQLLHEMERAASQVLSGVGSVTLPDGFTLTRATLPAWLPALDLQRVRAAIEAIESGAQSYAIDGRSLTKANLAELYARLRELESRAAQTAAGRAGGGRVHQIVPGL